MHLAIRADGGPNIGYGHLVRTGALAKHALQKGNRVTYASHTPEATREVCPKGLEIVSLDADRPHDALLEWLSSAKPDAVLTDSYEVGTDHQREIAKQVPTLAVILDDTRFQICADILINGNVYAPELEYEWIGSEPRWCLGTDYILLREEIRERAAERSPFREAAERALITMGGSDIRGKTPQIVRAFEGTDLRVAVIVGPGFENRPEIDSAVGDANGDIDVLENPADLVDRMFQADLAVSATGSMIYELLALGTPTIGLPQAENQELIATALADRGAIITLDDPVEQLSDEIVTLAETPDRRRALRECGVNLVDVQGVERVYDTLRGPGSR